MPHKALGQFRSSLVMPNGADVTVESVPSFADRLDITIQVDGTGTLNADTGYNGDSFVIGDADTQGFFITEDGAHDLAGPGVKLINVAYCSAMICRTVV